MIEISQSAYNVMKNITIFFALIIMAIPLIYVFLTKEDMTFSSFFMLGSVIPYLCVIKVFIPKRKGKFDSH